MARLHICRNIDGALINSNGTLIFISVVSCVSTLTPAKALVLAQTLIFTLAKAFTSIQILTSNSLGIYTNEDL